jgi:hypothetical protein
MITRWLYNCDGGNVYVDMDGDGGFAKILNPVEKKKMIVGRNLDHLHRQIVTYLKEWGGEFNYRTSTVKGNLGYGLLIDFENRLKIIKQERKISSSLANRLSGEFDVIHTIEDGQGIWYIPKLEKDLIPIKQSDLRDKFKELGYYKEYRVGGRDIKWDYKNGKYIARHPIHTFVTVYCES